MTYFVPSLFLTAVRNAAEPTPVRRRMDSASEPLKAAIREQWLASETKYFSEICPRFLLLFGFFMLLMAPLDLAYKLRVSPSLAYALSIRLPTTVMLCVAAVIFKWMPRPFSHLQMFFIKITLVAITVLVLRLQYRFAIDFPDSKAILYPAVIISLVVRVCRLRTMACAVLFLSQAVVWRMMTEEPFGINALGFQALGLLFSIAFLVQLRVEDSRFVDGIVLNEELKKRSAELAFAVSERDVIVQRQSHELAAAQVAVALGRATQMLAHDVRSPLSRVRALIDAVRASPDEEERARIIEASLPDIDRSLVVVDAMVADVMNVSARRPLARTAAEPVTLLETALKDALAHRGGGVRSLKVDCDFRHVSMLDIDVPRVARAFQNLLVNALEASGETARLRLATEESNGQVHVYVRNAGAFLEKAQCERLFELFYTSGKAQGTGLGLAIVKKAVEDHGGTVECHSARNAEEPAGYVEFRLALPAHAEESRSRELVCPLPAGPAVKHEVSSLGDVGIGLLPAQAPLETGERPCVAFLDDSVTFRVSWKAVLGRDVEVHTFASPEAFWDRVAQEPAFLTQLKAIVSDLHFQEGAEGEGEGLAFVAQLRERGFAAPIFLCTNDTSLACELGNGVIPIFEKTPLPWVELRSRLG